MRSFDMQDLEAKPEDQEVKQWTDGFLVQPPQQEATSISYVCTLLDKDIGKEMFFCWPNAEFPLLENVSTC